MNKSNSPPPGQQEGQQEDPLIPDGIRVYAIGDVHGRADLLGRLLKKIASDATNNSGENFGKNPGKTPINKVKNVLIMLGDLVDRGPDSRGVLELLQSGLPKEIAKGFEIVMLRGNHEVMMMDFIRGRDDAYDWLGNGGMETLESYDIDPHDREIDKLTAQFKQKLPKSHLELLKKMKLRHRIGDYMFVHAGIRPGVALKNQHKDDLVWIRHSFLDSKVDFGFVVVHGHSIRPEPEIRPNRIGIDTGAWMSGCLTALVLEGKARRFIKC
ncbi:MAG: serine/threonine protein phosphatase [Rhodospirillaceae bacterium]|nr:serine/threonine protein phosphatase [Rhodospirillaceae bacterium]